MDHYQYNGQQTPPVNRNSYGNQIWYIWGPIVVKIVIGMIVSGVASAAIGAAYMIRHYGLSAQMTDYAQQIFADCKDRNAYDTRMSSVTKKYPDAKWNPETQILSFTVDFAKEQAIYIEVSIPYSSTLIPEILTWKTISFTSWNPDTRQPVYKGDTK